MITLNLSQEDIKNLAEMVEFYFIPNIKEAEDLDNIEYIRSMLNCLDELKKVASL